MSELILIFYFYYMRQALPVKDDKVPYYFVILFSIQIYKGNYVLYNISATLKRTNA